jgi:phosphatidylglycerophosphatase A
MFSMILSWLTGGGIAAIGKELNAAYATKLNAKTDQERVQADVIITQLQAQQAVLIAEQGSWMTRWIRPAFALPFVIYDAKIIVWDKVLGLGATDALSPEFWQLQMIVFGAFFLTRPFEKAR